MKDKSIHFCIALVKMLKKVYSKKKFTTGDKKQYNKVANDLGYFQMCKMLFLREPVSTRQTNCPMN